MERLKELVTLHDCLLCGTTGVEKRYSDLSSSWVPPVVKTFICPECNGLGFIAQVSDRLLIVTVTVPDLPLAE